MSSAYEHPVLTLLVQLKFSSRHASSTSAALNTRDLSYCAHTHTQTPATVGGEWGEGGETHRLLMDESEEDVKGFWLQLKRLAGHVLVALGHQVEALPERNKGRGGM